MSQESNEFRKIFLKPLYHFFLLTQSAGEPWNSKIYTRLCSMAYRVAAPREETPILLKIEVRWELTVRGLITSRSATCSLVSPCATSRSTSTSRAVSPSG